MAVGTAEKACCTPIKPRIGDFNTRTKLPCGVGVEHIYRAMTEFADFLKFVNTQLYTRKIARLESLMMAANFSSLVGEFVGATIPKHCSAIVKNRYHNGHPDLIPAGSHPGDAVQHGHEGVEIKASRYLRGWQGHNPEDTWLMVFVFDSNRPPDVSKGVAPRPFRFVTVVGAALTKEDWAYSGRSEESRRTITASVTASGHTKMTANWIFRETRP